LLKEIINIYPGLLMISKIILFLFGLTLVSYAQKLQTGSIGNLELVNGQEIEDCEVTYRISGNIENHGSNVIVFPTWFAGSSESSMNLARRLFDSTYCIIAVDALGNGFSSSPSNSVTQKDSLFPQVTIRDIVNSQYILLTKILGLKHIRGVMGGSLGGMQVFQWVVSYPEFMYKGLAYVSSPQLTPFDLMQLDAQIQAIEMWERNGGTIAEIEALVSTIHHLLATTPEHKNQQVKREGYDEYMDFIRSDALKIFHPYDWKLLLKAMSMHDISIDGSLEKAAESIKCDFFIMAGTQDHLVNPVPAVEFADKYNFKKYLFDNNCGHLSPGCDWDTFAGLVQSFFNDEPMN
jgi:homoserine O-acetyltransferase/O-succinyltransferase